MTRVLPRTNFHSSKLIRCLADLTIVDAVEPGAAFAEKLGLWIHFTDAITLSAVHNDGIASHSMMKSEAQSVAGAAAGTAAEHEFNRIQASLTNSILKSCSPGVSKSHIRLPIPNLELPLDIGTAYTPYRRFYDAHQHDMELTIQPLRVNVRLAVANASPTLTKLADLDAALEKILRDRERQLLSKVPVLLKKRFEYLFKAHQQVMADTQQADNPASWPKAGGWLNRFCDELQMVLLAELDLRLQPTVGLIEAMDIKNHNE